MTRADWVHLTSEQLEADPSLEEAIARFEAPGMPAGEAAERWLKERALAEMDHIATYLLIEGGKIAAFSALGMSEVILSTGERARVGPAEHPRQGAVLILWLARAQDAHVDAEAIFRHAVGIAQIGARNVGAIAIALDPYDAPTEAFWRQRFGFRRSLTRVVGAGEENLRRLWLPLFPEG